MTTRAVAGDGHVGTADLAELGRVDVDVDDLGLGGEGADLAGDPVVEAAAQGDEQIGLLHGGDGGVVAVHAGHAQAQRVAVGEGAAGHEGGDHGDAGALGQRAQGLGGTRLQDPAAGVDDGALRRRSIELGRPADLRRGHPRSWAGSRAGRARRSTTASTSPSWRWRCPWARRRARARGGRWWRRGRPRPPPGACPGRR